MAPPEVLRLLAAVAEGSWNGDLEKHTSADEAAHILARHRAEEPPLPRGYAQALGHKFAALERRGFLERQRTDWGNTWRLAPRVRALFDGSRS